MLLGAYADSWKRTGTAECGRGSERGEENRERVKGKMTSTLSNMETGGRKRRKLDCNLKKAQLLVGTKLSCIHRPMM